MSIVIPHKAKPVNAALTGTKAKKAMSKAVGKSTAKKAKAPTSKAQTLAKHAKKAEEANASWEQPNLLAMCRKLAGGDLLAGTLLHHIFYVWRNRTGKLKWEVSGWSCDEWLAHSRDAWAAAAGLTPAEMKNHALPRLRSHCHEFVSIRSKNLGTVKKLWISVDFDALQELVTGSQAMPWDMFFAALNGISAPHPKTKKSPVMQVVK